MSVRALFFFVALCASIGVRATCPSNLIECTWSVPQAAVDCGNTAGTFENCCDPNTQHCQASTLVYCDPPFFWTGYSCVDNNPPPPPPDVCGDGVVTGSEICDTAIQACCGSDCLSYKSASTVCRASAGPCDAAESCPGNSPACPADTFLPSTSACRAANGSCDLPENCTGSSASCPTDTFKASTTVCRATAGVCDLPENCTGSGPACPTDTFRPSAFTCRAANGTCDVSENCPGNSAACPADAYLPVNTTCRAAASGGCDVAEVCSGSSPACPADGFQPSSFICRASAGACDLAEQCPGNSSLCPTDTFLPSTSVCRAAAGGCDVAESCTGSSAACPADVFQANSVVCRASAGTCDVAETCPGNGPQCPTDAFLPATTVCRSAAPGGCDLAENCTGASASCPADAFQPANFVCRAGAGVCDLAETCPGTGVTCPADAFQPSNVTCRVAAGVCDVAESCTGSGVSCPPDSLLANGTLCRGAVGACDLPEVCTGLSAACPADAVASVGTVCRVGASDCDPSEVCAGGNANDCPADVNTCQNAVVGSSSSAGLLSGTTVIGISVGAAVALILLLTCAVAFLLFARRQNRRTRPNEDIPMQTKVDSSDAGDYKPMSGFGSDELESSKYRAIIPPASSAASADEQSPRGTSLPRAELSNATWRIAYSELTLLEKVGSGAYGVVNRGNWRGTEVAIKQLKLEDSAELQLKAQEEFVKEATVMARIRPHPNVVGFLGACVDPDTPLCLVTEFMGLGSLHSYLQKATPPHVELLRIIRGSAAGINHLHQEGVVHRDIAARNVLLQRINEQLVPKITDFGMSRVMESQQQSGTTKADVGPLKWMAPESLQYRTYSVKSDAWSFGVLCWETVNGGADPYGDIQSVMVAAKVLYENLRLELPDAKMWPSVREVMRRCFAKEASDRPLFSEILVLLSE